MKQVEFSEFVSDDLDEIWFYIAQDNIEAADRLIRSFISLYKILATNPYIGRSRDDLLDNLKSFPHGSYIIFYFPTDNGVEIYRVLHAARDIEKIFNKEIE